MMPAISGELNEVTFIGLALELAEVMPIVDPVRLLHATMPIAITAANTACFMSILLGVRRSKGCAVRDRQPSSGAHLAARKPARGMAGSGECPHCAAAVIGM